MSNAYYCDRKKDCRTSPLCGVECKHTTDAAHALYDPPREYVEIAPCVFEERERPATDRT